MGYDPASRLTTMVQGSNTTTYGYDNNGNTTFESIPGGSTYYAYDYDPRNRLTAYNLETGGSTLPIATISYDGDGLRRTKITQTNVTTYIWDGVDYLAEESSGSLDVIYATMNGQLVEENRGGTITEYVPDTLGSVIQTTNASGTQTSSATYWPYGDTRTSTGTNPSPWNFVGTYGYYVDSGQSGSPRYYIRARDYRPDLSRWLTVDPLWPKLVAYLYCLGDPVTDIDPLGMFTKAECRAACVMLKPKDRGACKNVCKELDGNSCQQLHNMCEHGNRHHESRFDRKVCWAVYQVLCGEVTAPEYNPVKSFICSPHPVVLPLPAGGGKGVLRPIAEGGGAMVACWCAWEGVKWVVAICTIPETCGSSLAGAAALP